MDADKQRLLIEYLISSPDTFAICQGIVKPEYFNPEFKNTVRFIKQYYENYNSTPSPEQIKAETKQSFVIKDVTPDQIAYCTKEVESFCKRQALVNAVLASPPLIDAGDYGKLEASIREAILISLNNDLGTSYYDDPLQRLNKMLQEDPTESTGWSTVDNLLFGGITRKELLLLSANSGGGKSITLANLAYNFARRGRNVCYISLELSEEIIAQRFDTMHTGIGRKEWKAHVSEISNKVEIAGRKAGRLDIKQLPSGTNASTIRAYLKEYYLMYKVMPDLLVVDYLDNMSPNEFVSADNVWEKDKRTSEQLRQILVDYNMFGATASQLNRDAVKASQHDHSHIAGGISKINVADVYISIKMTDAMRAQGEIMFSFQKTRNSDGVGQNVFLNWDRKRLLITDKDAKEALPTNLKSGQKLSGAAVEKPIFEEETPSGRGLMELFPDDE